MRAATAALLLGSLCWACAHATPYAPKDGGPYGYDERQLAPDTFLVRFSGNPKNTPHEVERNVLKRAAHLALEHGFSHFSLTDTRDETRRVPGLSGRFAVPAMMPGQAIIVKCFHGSPDWIDAVDAEWFLSTDW